MVFKEIVCGRLECMSRVSIDLMLERKMVMMQIIFIDHIVTYSGLSIHDGTLLHSRSQYTTVKHSQQLFEHT
jgi:hypothetical protein